MKINVQLSEEQKVKVKQLGIRLAILVGVALLAAVFVELVFNFRRIRIGSEARKTVDITAEDVELIGFTRQGDTFITTGEENRLIIRKSSAYTRKIAYDCSVGRDFYARIYAYQTPVGAEQPVFTEYVDRNNLCIYHSEQWISTGFDHLEISFEYYDEGEKEMKPIAGLEISDISYVNRIDFNARRMWLAFMFVALIMFMVFWGELLVRRIEIGFVAAALGIGLVMVFGFPSYKISWDEEAHFLGAYRMGIGTDVVMTPEVDYYGDANRVASLFYPMAEVEFGQFQEFLNASRIYDKTDPDNYVIKSGLGRLSDVGHIAPSIGIQIGRIFHLPLGYLYLLGKLTNLLMYVGITYLAIRHMRIGKGIMTVLALMPTVLFQATAYTYDATANAFMFLAMSYLFTAIVDKDTVFDVKQCAVVAGGIAVASCVRVVYAPMILLLLFVPKERFKSKKSWAVIKGGLLAVCVIGAAGLLYVATHSEGIEADIRGGAVSVSGQISYIMQNPIAYGKMVVKYIWEQLGDYTIGYSTLGQFAHLRGFPYSFVIYVVMLFFIFTDTTDVDLKWYTRIGVAIVLLGTTVGIWSSMYIFFTPVGADWIGGVQGRYFTPLLIPLYLLFNTRYIKNEIPKRVYNTMCVMVPIFITSGMTFVLMTVLGS
ncbi:MAG: DUF2142 domain-containing protein [Lachnospiraceae bacterium]|nr:DUF2142 domain-containing protein [Lachnospiraceae bacterium]